MTGFAIDTLTIPATIDAPDARDFVVMTGVRNEVEAEKMGSSDLAYQPVELLSKWQNPYSPIIGLVARVGGRIVARAEYQATLEDAATDAWFELDVLPEFRRLGIGSALFARIRALCEADGRTVLQCYVNHGRTGGEAQLPPRTGFGAVPRESAATQFLLTHGFTLVQVARISRVTLPVEEKDLAADLSAVKEAAARDYRIIQWTGHTPAALRASMASLYQRMSTDAPSAGLESTEEAWDADRVDVHSIPCST